MNCLVIGFDPATGRQWGPLLEKARASGIATAARTSDPGAARKAGFSAALVAGASAGDPFVIPLAPIEKMAWHTAAEVIAVEALWPRVKSGREAAAEAGPTGQPWVDANGWLARLAGARAPGKSIWLVSKPEDRQAPAMAAYQLTVADAGASGARWLIAPPEPLTRALADGETQAVRTWQTVAATAGFFEEHAAWRRYRPVAALGIISDFSGQNQFLALETLNLAARRLLQCAILEKSQAVPQRFTDLKAILYADAEPPAPVLAKALAAFAAGGGLVIAGPAAGSFLQGKPDLGASHRRWELRRVGKGSAAVARQTPSDPYELAADVHTLMSRRHDPVRLWNTGSAICEYTVAPDGSAGVVQIVNYSARAQAHPMTLGVKRRWRTARLWRPGLAQAEPLKAVQSGQGLEVPLPPLPVYGAIELGA
jgi:hypothetical protein